jgi:ketosteroid isomerase-like protein
MEIQTSPPAHKHFIDESTAEGQIRQHIEDLAEAILEKDVDRILLFYASEYGASELRVRRGHRAGRGKFGILPLFEPCDWYNQIRFENRQLDSGDCLSLAP